MNFLHLRYELPDIMIDISHREKTERNENCFHVSRKRD